MYVDFDLTGRKQSLHWVLTGFIVDGHNPNNIRYECESVLIVDTEWNLQELVQTIANENKKTGLNNSCKETNGK